MESFRHKGKTLNFRKLTGVVIGIRDRSESRLHSSGGGGYVGPHGGYVSAPTIRMETTARLEIWIRTDKGNEECAELPTTDIPLKEGQRITLVFYVGPENKNHVSILVNHNARRHWFVLNAESFAQAIAINPIRTILGCLAFRSSAVIGTLMSRLAIVHLAALALGYVIFMKTNSPLLGWGVAGALWFFYIMKMRKEFSTIRQKIEAHLEHLVEQAYAQ